MRVILDTCVVSELGKTQGASNVRARVDEYSPEQLYLSVLTIGEIAKGVARLTIGERKQHLASWLLKVENEYSGNLLPVDVEVARLWGEITAKSQLKGIQTPVTDGLIAATALRHGMHVMTRNLRHFNATGVPTIDPWE